jgi:GntR family transcriptional repressor for pyruvate dehydrogenase complex
MEFSKIKEKRVFEKIVDQIRDAVLSGSLKPGDALPTEGELAGQLGVSRAALREALRVLELSGVVVIRKGNKGGTFVQNVPSNKKLFDYFSNHLMLGNFDLEQLTDMRYWIESTIIDILSKKVTKKVLDDLRQSAERAEDLYHRGCQAEKLYENFNFHMIMARATGNRIVVDMLSAICDLISYLMVKMKPSDRMAEKAFEAHREVVDLLEAGEWKKAKTLNGAHIKELSVNYPEFRLRLPANPTYSLSLLEIQDSRVERLSEDEMRTLTPYQGRRRPQVRKGRRVR